MSDETCIICNKSFKRLSSHVRAHGLTISQYNEKKAATITKVDVTKATYDTQHGHHRRHNQFEKCANKCNCPFERQCTDDCRYWSKTASILIIDS